MNEQYRELYNMLTARKNALVDEIDHIDLILEWLKKRDLATDHSPTATVLAAEILP